MSHLYKLEFIVIIVNNLFGWVVQSWIQFCQIFKFLQIWNWSNQIFFFENRARQQVMWDILTNRQRHINFVYLHISLIYMTNKIYVLNDKYCRWDNLFVLCGVYAWSFIGSVRCTKNEVVDSWWSTWNQWNLRHLKIEIILSIGWFMWFSNWNF